MADRSLVNVHAILTADASQMRQTIEQQLGRLPAEIASKTKSIGNAGSRQASAQTRVASEQTRIEAGITAAERSGALDPKIANEIRQFVRTQFDSIRRELAQAINVEQIAPPTQKQYASGERAFNKQNDQRAADEARNAEARRRNEQADQDQAAREREILSRAKNDSERRALRERQSIKPNQIARDAGTAAGSTFMDTFQKEHEAGTPTKEAANRADNATREAQARYVQGLEASVGIRTKSENAAAVQAREAAAASQRLANEADERSVAEARAATGARQAAKPTKPTVYKSDQQRQADEAAEAAAEANEARRAQQAKTKRKRETDRERAERERQDTRAFGSAPLDPATRARFRDDMTPRNPQDPTTAPGFERAENNGVDEALRRFYGLMVGLSSEVEQQTEALSTGLRVLRANVTAMAKFRAANEEAAEQQLLYNDLTGKGQRDLFSATKELALIREKRALAEGRAVLEGTKPLVDEQGAARRAERIRKAEIELADYQRDPDRSDRPAGQPRTGSERQVDADAARQRETLGRLRAARDRATDSAAALAAAENRAAGAVDRSARRRSEEALTRRAVADRQTEMFEAAGGYENGTWFQRQQARISQRQGQPPRSPQDYQTGRQFIESKALTTAGFAATGGLMYGALSLGGDILRESTELQQELAIIQTQFDSLQSTADGMTFDQFRAQIKATSVDTGVAANDVAKVQRQLAGAFASDKGDPNFQLAAREGRTALQYSKVSGLEQQEITDSLTAVALAFRDGDVPMEFSEILDTITDLENRFGVLGPEILKFTADLAPLGKELGLTQEQLAGLGAVAQQASGKSGAVLAEQLGRILPSMKEKAGELYDLFDSNAKTRPVADDLAGAFAAGESDQALSILVKNYGLLDKAQKNSLANLVGGKREAATFYALLDRGTQTLDVLNPGAKNEGAFDKRWSSYKETVTYSIEQMRRTVEEFGQLLFEAGLADILTGMADAATLFAGGLTVLVKAVGELNSALGGIPARAAGLALLFKLITGLGGLTGVGKALGAANAAQGLAATGGLSRTQALVQNARRPGGIASIYTGAGQVMPEGFIGPAPAAMRPSVVTASKSTLLRNALNRNPAGQITSGLGTSMAAAGAIVAPIASAMVVSFAAQEILRIRGEIDAKGADFRTKVQKQLEAGVSREEIIRQAKAAGAGDTGFVRSVGETIAFGQTTDDAIFGIIDEEASKFNVEEVAAPLQALADARGAQRQQILDGISSLFAEGYSSSPLLDDDSRNALRDIFDVKTNATSGVDMNGDPTKAGAVTDFKITSGALAELAQKIRDEPQNAALQNAANFLMTLPLGPEARKEIQAVLDDVAADKKLAKAEADKILEDAEAELERGDYETRLESKTAAYNKGESGFGRILSEMRDRRAGLKKRIDETMAGIDTSELRKELDKLDEAIGSTAIDDLLAGSQFTGSVIDAGSGSKLDKSAAKSTLARETFDRIRGTREASVKQRADAAMDVLAAQQEEFDAQIDAATSPEEINRLYSEGIEIPDAVRRDIIGQQLNTGANSDVIESIAEYMNIQADEARKIVVDAMTSAEGLNGSLLRASLLGRKAQLEAVLKTIGSGTSLRVAEGQSSQLSEVNGLLAGIETQLASIEDPGTITGGTAGEGGDDDRLEKLKAQAQAKAALARARAGNDVVAQARADVDAARAQLNIANQGDDQNEKDTALAALISAETALGNVIRNRANALRQSAFDLASARAAGDPMAQANIAVAAARAALGAATTPEESAAGEVALANALNGQRDAVVADLEARGEYLSSLLSGDSVGQAQQNLSNANAALARARPGERYAALQRVNEAQKALATSLLDVFIAQKDLAIAVAEGAGKTVEVAMLQLQQAQARLKAAQDAGLQGAQLDAVKADAQRAQNNAIQTVRADRLGDLDYLFEFGKITAGAYINLLKGELLKIPESDKDARREIERKIKALRDEISADVAFNIPGEIRLPTLYEVRRLDQSTGGSGGSYQDNRVVTVNVYDGTNAARVVQVVTDALDAPPRVGSAPRNY